MKNSRFKKTRSTHAYSFWLIFLATLLGGCHVFEALKPEENFQCKGTLETMFSQEPMSIKIVNNTLTISSNSNDSSSSNEINDNSIMPLLSGNYDFNIQYPNGIYLTRVDENEINIQHLHINGTILLNKCKFLYPIEIDSLKGLFKLWPIF